MTGIIDKIIDNAKNDFKSFQTWFGMEEQIIVMAAKPRLQELGTTIEKDLWATCLAALPILQNVLQTSGWGAVVTAAETVIKTALTSEGKVISQAAIGIGANILGGLASDAVAAGSVVTAPVAVAPVAGTLQPAS